MVADRRQKFYALVAPHLERLYRAACRMEGNAADAQDLGQDTCLVACEKLNELEATTCAPACPGLLLVPVAGTAVTAIWPLPTT
jgi:hypothetical protein